MADDATLTIKLAKSVADRLSRLAAQEGATAEALAAEAIGDMIDLAAMDGPPELHITDAELEASINEHRRQVAEGSAIFYEHDEVMAGARAIVAAAKAKKSQDKKA